MRKTKKQNGWLLKNLQFKKLTIQSEIDFKSEHIRLFTIRMRQKHIAIQKLIQALVDSNEAMCDFESAMRKVSRAQGLSVDEINKLEQEVRKMGKPMRTSNDKRIQGTITAEADGADCSNNDS